MNTIVPTVGDAKPFCHVSSEDPMYSSNLQLYSLRQAFRHWREFQTERDALREPQIRERLVFITATVGLSLSQLLGQNTEHDGERVATPKPLFDQLLGEAHPLGEEFRGFIDIYDNCRHFGRPKYETVAALTEDQCRRFLDLAVELWDVIVRKYIDENQDTNGALAEFRTVRDLVGE